MTSRVGAKSFQSQEESFLVFHKYSGVPALGPSSAAFTGTSAEKHTGSGAAGLEPLPVCNIGAIGNHYVLYFWRLKSPRSQL